MALLFMDSFDHYVTADLPEKWSVVNTQVGSIAINASAGRRSSGAVRISSSYGGTTFLGLNTPVTAGQTVIVGMAVNLDRFPVFGPINLIALRNAGNHQLTLFVNGDAKLRIARGGGYGTSLGVSSTNLTFGTLQYVELKVLLSTTVGTVDVRINGVSVLSLTGQNTCGDGNTNLTNITIGNSENNLGSTTPYPIMDIDDLYYCDGTGSAPHNNLLGDVRVDARRPTGVGWANGFVPSAGANWQCVDDVAPNDDTDYNATANTSTTDLFVTEDSPVVGATVLGVQVNMSAKKMDAGTCTVAAVVRNGGVDVAATAQAPATAYAYLTTPYQINPVTSTPWTEAVFNASEFGYRRIT